MSREVRRAHKKFKFQLGETWWGYLLAALYCQSCTEEDDDCATCEGEHSVQPIVEPPTLSHDHVFTYGEEEYGWQMWQTVSEGGPISIVCDSPEELAHWLEDNNASSFGYDTSTYEQWLKMIKGPGWSISGVYTPEKGIQSGVNAIEDLAEVVSAEEMIHDVLEANKIDKEREIL